MWAIFDHLNAILVGTGLLVVLVFITQRTKTHAVETTQQHTTMTLVQGFVDMLERDVENMQPEDATVAALGSATLSLTTQSGQLNVFTFPTLADPSLGTASPIVHVSYVREATGRTVLVNGQSRTVYRVARYVNNGAGNQLAGGSGDVVLDVRIKLYPRGASIPVYTAPALADLHHVGLEVQMATQPLALTSHDQASRSQLTLVQRSYTFRPSNPALPL